MPPALAPLLWLHIGATILAAGCALSGVLRPAHGGLLRALDVAVALLAAAALPLASAGGWWIDIPDRWMVPILLGLSAALALFGARVPLGRLPALVLAAFFLTLGAASLRNGGPLMGFLALKAVLLGLVLALLPPEKAVRLRMLLLLAALVAATTLGVLRDIPIP